VDFQASTAVIAQLHVSADSFELGRILGVERGTAIEPENLVPLGETAIPFFSVSADARSSFEAAVRDHPSVDGIEEISQHADETLYALEWDAARDAFVRGVIGHGGQILAGAGTWNFGIRFPDHQRVHRVLRGRSHRPRRRPAVQPDEAR
jgi:hypothetical protein